MFSTSIFFMDILLELGQPPRRRSSPCLLRISAQVSAARTGGLQPHPPTSVSTLELRHDARRLTPSTRQTVNPSTCQAICQLLCQFPLLPSKGGPPSRPARPTPRARLPDYSAGDSVTRICLGPSARCPRRVCHLQRHEHAGPWCACLRDTRPTSQPLCSCGALRPSPCGPSSRSPSPWAANPPGIALCSRPHPTAARPCPRPPPPPTRCQSGGPHGLHARNAMRRREK